MANKNICIHKNECPIYQGNTISDNGKLTIYKNVFCNRGYRGWRNCKEYLIFENKGHSSSNKEID